MNRLILIVTAALCAFATAASAETKNVASLSWLSGSWASEEKEGWTEEQWMPPRGGVMLGLNRSGKGDKASGFEFMRIASGPDGISFWASPSGAKAVPFRLVHSGPNEAIFENPANDYPVRIVYRRKAHVLMATISGPGGANPMSWTFKRR